MADRFFADTKLAALYDRFYPAHERDDLAFYLPLVMKARSVLDVGCGTGAMLHMARDYGHRGRLCGLDPAPGMIELARRRSDIEWVLGDLGSVLWTGEFELVVMTGHAFQVLVEDREIREALAAIRRALAADGRFAFETRNPRARAWERWTPANARETVDAHGATVRMTTELEGPFDGRVVTFTHTFSSAAWSREQLSRSTLRFLDEETLGRFLAEARLGVEAQFGDWNRRALSATAPEIITVARPN